MFRKTGLLLVQVDRDKIELHRRPFLRFHQDVEQGERILATRQAHHYPVALADHVEIRDGAPGVTLQAFGQFGIRITFFSSNHPRILR